MTTDFPIDHVVVAGGHDSEDGYALFSPDDLQCFGKRGHEEEEQYRGHVVALAYTDCLGDFDCFFLNLQHAYVVGVDRLDCCDKLRRGAIAFEDAQEQVVVGCVVGFDEVNKAYVRSKVMVPSCVEESFEGEEPVSAAKFRGAAELETSAMFVE